jgi:hypothetical protein
MVLLAGSSTFKKKAIEKNHNYIPSPDIWKFWEPLGKWTYILRLITSGYLSFFLSKNRPTLVKTRCQKKK